MAIEYSLALGTPLTTAQVAGELRQAAQTLGLFDATVTPELLLEEVARSRFDTRIQVVDANPRPWNAVIEDLGFTPTVRVEFRLDKFTDMSAQKDDMIRLVSDLLDRVPGDAVLHFQYEQIWLLRRNGELTLSERDDIWPPQRLAAVHQPYRRATHTFS
jgi:hypothetical protein